MRKILLSVVLGTFMLCIPVSAENDLASYNKQDYGFDIDFNRFSHDDDCLIPMELGIISHDPFVSMMGVSYFALPKDAVYEIDAGFFDLSEQDKEKVNGIIRNSGATIAYILVSDKEEDAALDAAGITRTDDVSIVEFGTIEPDFHYYYLTFPFEDFITKWSSDALGDESFEKDVQDMENILGLDTAVTLKGVDDLRADIEDVRERILESLQETELTAPVDEADDYVGKTIRFETTDLDGNTVSSTDLFKENKITMINVWGTWCGYCVDEMEELAAINTRLQEKGCGIVGVEYEGMEITPELVQKAKDLLEEKGTNYPNVIVPDGDPVFSSITGYPTTFFVDEEGKILTFPITGADISAYEITVEKLLEEMDE